MRTLHITVAALLLPASLAAQGARVAAPSTRATTEVSFTFADTAAQRAAGKPALLRIDYGQPHLRGRALYTDSLVPYDQVWRLGANAATVLTTDVDLTIGGQPVPRGQYILQAIPRRSGWVLFVQKHPGGAGPVNPIAYDAANDVARVPLRVTTLTSPVESLSMWLIPARAAGAPRGELRIAWGTTALSAEWSAR